MSQLLWVAREGLYQSLLFSLPDICSVYHQNKVKHFIMCCLMSRLFVCLFFRPSHSSGTPICVMRKAQVPWNTFCSVRMLSTGGNKPHSQVNIDAATIKNICLVKTIFRWFGKTNYGRIVLPCCCCCRCSHSLWTKVINVFLNQTCVGIDF